MSFINPFLIIGIIAAGIPLIIHLWSRRQAKLLDFSSLQFLMALNRKKVKRLKLKQILLLILRMLIIALIALALARPVIEGKWAMAAGSRAKRSVVIIIDNSYSMSHAGLEGDRFKIAKDKAVQILDSMQSGDDASLILMSDYPEVIFKRLTSDIGQVKDAVYSARISHRGTYVMPSLKEAFSILNDSKKPYRQIYLISDLGENGWRNWRKETFPQEIGLSVIRIGDKQVNNCYIDNIAISSGFAGVGMLLQFTARVKGNSDKVAASLIIDGEKEEQGIVSNNAVSFSHVFLTPGIHTGEVRLSSDQLEVDDVRYFAISVIGQTKVLIVGEANFYINLALNPSDSTIPGSEPMVIPSSASIEELGSISLDQYSAVILSDAKKLNDSAVRNLSSFFSKSSSKKPEVINGNIIIFLGKSSDRDWYNASFALMPASLASRASYSQNPLRISKWDSSHPIFRIFDEKDAADTLRSPETYSAFPMVPKSNAKIVASFDRNIPAIIEMVSEKRNKVILFNSSPDPEVTDLPLKPVFLPLIHQTLLYMVSDDDNRNIQIGDSYIKNIYENAANPEIILPSQSGLAGKEQAITIKPEFTNLEQGIGKQVKYASADYAGIYKLRYMSENTMRQDYFAVNLNTKEESDLKSLSDEEIIDKLGSQIRLSSSYKYTEEAIAPEKRKEIASTLLVIAAILMMLEIPLASRYKERIKDEG